MKHFIIAAYVLLFMSGSAGLIALGLLGVRLKSRIVGYLFTIQILLLFGLAIVLIYFYLQNIITGPTSFPFINFLAISSTLIQTMLYIVGFEMIRKLKQTKRLGFALRNTSLWLCFLVIITGFATIGFTLVPVYIRDFFRSFHSIFSLIGYILVGITLLMLGITLYIAPLTGEHSATRFLTRGWAICLIAFLPLTVLEWLLETFGSHSYSPLSLDFLFYLGCNVVSLLALIRSIKVEHSETEPALLSVVSDDIAARFALTGRERDMVPLIARGLANKQIAAELGISNATVRTHIYNLFQKVGAKSRIELLNRLDS